MKKKLEAWVIGGDGRYAWAARQLRSCLLYTSDAADDRFLV